MAINSYVDERNLRSFHLKDVDVHLLAKQLLALECVLRNHDVKDESRRALTGLLNMLDHMRKQAGMTKPRTTGRYKKFTHTTVHQARDLLMLGKSREAVAQQLDVSSQALDAMVAGKTYASLPYEPSEFGETLDAEAQRGQWPWLPAEKE